MERATKCTVKWDRFIIPEIEGKIPIFCCLFSRFSAGCCCCCFLNVCYCCCCNYVSQLISMFVFNFLDVNCIQIPTSFQIVSSFSRFSLLQHRLAAARGRWEPGRVFFPNPFECIPDRTGIDFRLLVGFFIIIFSVFLFVGMRYTTFNKWISNKSYRERFFQFSFFV